MILTAAYFLYMVVMAMFSDEKMSVQFLTIRQYIAVLFFIVPMWIFANNEFDIKYFMSRILVFFIIISAFYAFDALILNGWVLVPADSGAWNESTFADLTWRPLSFMIPRKYPGGYYIAVIAAYPLARYYRLKWWGWAIIVAGLLVTRTMTFIAGFLLAYIVFQGTFKVFMKYSLAGIALLASVYFIDISTGNHLRVASTAEQFYMLTQAQDDQDVSQFGSTRMAQILPKFDALLHNNALMTGFGFLHPTKSTNPKYQFHNEYYSDWVHNDDSIANSVEVTQFNTLMHLGLLGLIVQTAYFLWIFFILKRKGRGSAFYMSTLLSATIMGVGGFAGLNHADGLVWVGTALGIALLESRRHGHDRAEDKIIVPKNIISRKPINQVSI